MYSKWACDCCCVCQTPIQFNPSSPLLAECKACGLNTERCCATFHMVTAMPPLFVPELYHMAGTGDVTQQNSVDKKNIIKLKVLQCPCCDVCVNASIFNFLQLLHHQIVVFQSSLTDDIDWNIGADSTILESQGNWLMWNSNQPSLCPYCSVCMHEF